MVYLLRVPTPERVLVIKQVRQSAALPGTTSCFPTIYSLNCAGRDCKISHAAARTAGATLLAEAGTCIHARQVGAVPAAAAS